MRRVPPRPRALRIAAGALMAAAAALAGCKDDLDEDARSSPAAAALVASAPAMAALGVPPPPVLAAASAAPPRTGAASGAALEAVHAQLETLLGQATACTADAECRTVATGAKACGGPTAYRAYSATGADPAQVEALARREHELGMAQARAAATVSACYMLADPGAHCAQQRCVTGPAGPG